MGHRLLYHIKGEVSVFSRSRRVDRNLWLNMLKCKSDLRLNYFYADEKICENK